MNFIGIIKNAIDITKGHPFEDPSQWTVAFGPSRGVPVDEVKFGLTDAQTVWFKVKFCEDDIDKELYISDNIFSGSEDEVRCGSNQMTQPQVSMQATTYGVDTLALIVKCTYQEGDQTRSYRMDGHFPFTMVGEKLLRLII